MPCRFCGKVQTDPVRGASPWARAVSGNTQILVCPECQQEVRWRDELDRCAACGGTRLSKVMGSTVCRDCGNETPPGDERSQPTTL